MRPSFGVRRKPRKIGQDEMDNDGDTKMGGLSDYEQGKWLTNQLDNPSKIIRPSMTPASSKSKKRSSLRMSFGPGGTSMTEEDDSSESTVFTPKKSSLSRQAIEKNALRNAIVSSHSSESLRLRQTGDRPSYSADHLNELKSSTPCKPKDTKSLNDIEDDVCKALDLTAKFGTDLAVYSVNDSVIPTDAEIREKKERRARLAKGDFIALSDDDDENALQPHNKISQTRLVRDDEEFAEGFDEFVDDGRVALGRKAEREQKRRHEVEIRQLIQEAEGSSNESDDSEAERRAAYETAQTRAGMDGMQKDELTDSRARRPRTPPKITPLPSLSICLERLQANLSSVQSSRMQKIRRMEELQRDKSDIEYREGEIQRLLKEAGEKYEKLRAEANIAVGEPAVARNDEMLMQGLTLSRGIGNLVDT